jgi:hypothetical protein
MATGRPVAVDGFAPRRSTGDLEVPTHKPAAPRLLRLVREGDTPAAPAVEPPQGALQHTSQRGIDWFLHQGTTKTGKPKYFVAKKVGRGALAAMPAGFEFTESVNGVVSVRRLDATPKLVPDADVETVRAEVARHRHLLHHKVAAGRDAVLVYEPVGGRPDAELVLMAKMLRVPMGTLNARVRYEPVMRFVVWPHGRPGDYTIERMTYSGKGGWSYQLEQGPLAYLARKYVAAIGTEGFFELR